MALFDKTALYDPATGSPVISSASATDIVAVTKSDTVDDPNGPFRGIVFATAGILKIQTADGQARTIPSGVLAAGIIHPIQCTRVWSGTTTAVDVWGVK